MNLAGRSSFMSLDSLLPRFLDNVSAPENPKPAAADPMPSVDVEQPEEVSFEFLVFMFLVPCFILSTSFFETIDHMSYLHEINALQLSCKVFCQISS